MYSRMEYEYEGGSRVFTTNFAMGVLEKNHIQAWVRGELDGAGEQVYRLFLWDAATGNVTLIDDLPNPCTVVIDRTVPKDVLYVEFAKGAEVNKRNLDRQTIHAVMAVHEVLDGRWNISEDLQRLVTEAAAAALTAGEASDEAQAALQEIKDLSGGLATALAAGIAQINATANSANTTINNKVTQATNDINGKVASANTAIDGKVSTAGTSIDNKVAASNTAIDTKVTQANAQLTQIANEAEQTVEDGLAEFNAAMAGVTSFSRGLLALSDAQTWREALNIVFQTSAYDNTSGRVVRVGSQGVFGWGIPSGQGTPRITDMDAQGSITPGVYGFEADVDGINSPPGVTKATVIHTRTGSTGAETQLVLVQMGTAGAGTLMSRSRRFGAWGAWQSSIAGTLQSGSYDNTPGAILRIPTTSVNSVFGLGGLTAAITDVTRVDNSYVPGDYHVIPTTVGTPVGILYGSLSIRRRAAGGGEVMKLIAQDPAQMAGKVFTKTRGSGAWSEWRTPESQVDFDTIAEASAAYIPEQVKTITVAGIKHRRAEVAGSGPGKFASGGSGPSTLRAWWENVEEVVTPVLFATIQEFFAYRPTKCKKHLPAGEHVLSGPVTIPDESYITADVGASIRPSYIQAGNGDQATRFTPYITLGSNVTWDHISIHINSNLATTVTGPGGSLSVSQASLAVAIMGDNCNLGVIRVTSGAYNMCIRTSDVIGGDSDTPTTSYPYDYFGAVRLAGSNNSIKKVFIDNWRVGLVLDGDNVSSGAPLSKNNFVNEIDIRRASAALKMRRTANATIASGRLDSIPYLQQNRSWNVNGLLKGENGILWGGAQDCYIGYIEIYGFLEHNIRFGHGAETANLRNRLGVVKSVAAYGCGFKIDDADGHRTKEVHIDNLFVEDAGRDAENRPFDTANEPYNNKEALAVRNCDGFSVGYYECRKRLFPYCGSLGLMVEKSYNVKCPAVYIADSYKQGILVAINASTQGGGPYNVINVDIRGQVRNTRQGGVRIAPVNNTAAINKLTVMVDVFDCLGTAFIIEGRPNGTTYLAGPMKVGGTSRGVPVVRDIHSAIAADGNFIDRINDGQIKYQQSYNPPSVNAGAFITPFNVTVPGATVGDGVVVSGPATSVPFIWSGVVTAANTVSITAQNGGATVDPGAGTLTVLVFKT